MRNIHKTIQTISNVAVIIVELLFGGVLVNRYLLPVSQKPAAVESEDVKVGAKFSLPDADWSKSEKNLVLVLSTSCHFCSESTPFYQKLAGQKAERGDVRMIAVMPQTIDQARHYLEEHNLSVDEIRQASPDAVNVRGTPTLLLVDRSGTVVQTWKGKLSSEKETELASSVFGDRSGS